MRRSKGHVYAFTWGEADIRVTYSFLPGVPARIRYDEHDHPAEGPEIEIDKVEVEGWPGRVWRDATKDEFERFSEYAMALRFDDMVEEALSDRDASDG